GDLVADLHTTAGQGVRRNHYIRPRGMRPCGGEQRDRAECAHNKIPSFWMFSRRTHGLPNEVLCSFSDFGTNATRKNGKLRAAAGEPQEARGPWVSIGDLQRNRSCRF